MNPGFEAENRFAGLVVGVDEAGRGPWAGPVVAAAVVLDQGNCPADLDDSKKLTAARREQLYAMITANARVGIGAASVAEIDQLNILSATMLAMTRAVAALAIAPGHVLVDGNRLPVWPYAATAIIGGDGICQSIAAASIIAKVTRDRIMQGLDTECPGYGWARNMGYGTREHQAALTRLGVSAHHRCSFAPVKSRLAISGI